VITPTVSKARASTTSPLLSTFSQTEENACAYVSIKSRETPSNTAITLFVSPNPCLILITEDELIPGPGSFSRSRFFLSVP
jgi:hypothetical protein